MIDGIGNRCGDAANTQFANPLRLHRRRRGIDLVEENDVLGRDVGMNGHFISGKVMIDEEAEPLVDRQLLHQRRAHAPRHRADDLTARRSEEHTSELQSLMRTSYAVFYLKKKN